MSEQPPDTQGEKQSQIKSTHDYQTYLIWKTGHINNERKYLAWIRASIGLFTLGFIVERIELFLKNSAAREVADHFTDLPFSNMVIPLVFFALGGLIIIIATLEFFVDRRRLNEMEEESTRRLDVLIVSTLILLVVVAVLFLLPGFSV
ncbi:MAG: DUF202 domain-containing protein [Candidatus Marinimicrobia bacterium]|nr:DUF202 domain-containing protein [Candidatus Neomarinimicrobiota bacterium]MCF7828707.1 DUF202 domain-containing protein [Candidatus Neomarinimicrobiota bacterium]MCF7880448.1 DUF202 domain-containing protein [Candidatus Neomarinimicrobiota bacterium]